MSTDNALAAVVFDLDGTLVDSAEDLRAASNALLAELGRPPLDLATIKSFIGDGVAKLVERVLEASGGVPEQAVERMLLRRFLDIYEADPSSRTRPYPGVVETLQALRSQGLKLGICTNKPIIATQRLLDDLGLRPLVDAVVGGDSFPSRKPSPEPLLGLLAMLRVAPARAAMVGDNEHDVAAARAAAVAKVLIMRHGYSRVPLERLDHDGVLDSFSDLPGRLFEGGA
ncbi:MAG: phosphoglycolate phosphatase [Xanthomonadaceae bacterium]|nr:phosphoglycolate phosphatase [Xanthomonadaceae bacterium]